jgi:hypothetical protein
MAVGYGVVVGTGVAVGDPVGVAVGVGVVSEDAGRADGQGRILVGGVLVVEQTHVAVHLAHVLVGEPAQLQVHEQVALENAVVENQVDVEVLAVEIDAHNGYTDFIEASVHG